MGRFRSRSKEAVYVTEVVGTTYMKSPTTGAYVPVGTNTVTVSPNPKLVLEENDGCFDELHPGPPYRRGGPLYLWTSQRTYQQKIWQSVIYSATGKYKYAGSLYHRPGITDGDLGVDFSDTQVHLTDSWGGDGESYGATGWKKFKPGKPGMDLAVFLGELKDVPAMLKGTAKAMDDMYTAMGGNRNFMGPKTVSDAFLNTQFGWLPFLSDMRKFYTTLKTLDQRIQRIRRYNGQWERRGGAVVDDDYSTVLRESKTSYGGYITPTIGSYFHQCYPSSSPTGAYVVTKNVTTHAWFEAAFRYWIPDIDSVDWNRKAVRLMFGGSITPSLLWELTPWSWLIDYVSNAGDVFANMDNNLAENLAAKYAYVMKTKTTSVTSDVTANLLNQPVHGSYTAFCTTKNRAVASPFGFGLTSDMFSTRQWAILGALGLSRLR